MTKNSECNLEEEEGIANTKLNLLIRAKIKTTRENILSCERDHLTEVHLRLMELRVLSPPLFLQWSFTHGIKMKEKKPKIRNMRSWIFWNADDLQAYDIFSEKPVHRFLTFPEEEAHGQALSGAYQGWPMQPGFSWHGWLMTLMDWPSLVHGFPAYHKASSVGQGQMFSWLSDEKWSWSL